MQAIGVRRLASPNDFWGFLDHRQGAASHDVLLPQIPAYALNVADFGANGNGMTDNSQAFAEAIGQLSSLGGGRLIVGPGVWCTGPIRLKSRINLHLEVGAVVRFSRNPEDYELISTQFEGLPSVRCRSPIDGENLEDVAITGRGLFDGGGEGWRPVKKSKTTDRQWRDLVEAGGVLSADGLMWWPSRLAMEGAEVVPRLISHRVLDMAEWAPYREYLRPQLLSLRRCRRVLLEGVTFQNSPAWCLHLWASEQVTARFITVRNPWYAQNGDGIDVDSCEHVRIESSTFDVGDDAICLKSGKDRAGRELGLPTRDVAIEDCTVFHGHGGVTIGSEMSGGVDNVRVRNLTMVGTDIGLRFKSARGRGGVVENIAIEDVRMLDIAGAAISFDLFYESNAAAVDQNVVPVVDEETPRFRNIRIDRAAIQGARHALWVRGLPEQPIEQLTVSHLTAVSERGMTLENAAGVRLTEIHLAIQKGPWIHLKQTQDVFLEVVESARVGNEPCLRVSGAGTKNIQYRMLEAWPNSVLVDPDTDAEQVRALRSEASEGGG